MFKYIIEKASCTGVAHERHGLPNEDRCFAVQREDLIWMAVFDGVSQGGGGAMASSLAVESMQTALDNAQDESICQKGISIMRLTQERILAENAIHPEYGEMRTTGVIVCINTVNHSLSWFSIGDSAIFICPKRGIPIKLTREDSDIGELLSQGRITEEEASRRTAGHELNRYLGMDVQPDNIHNYIRTGTRSLSKEDSILCCSDGLYSKISPKLLRQHFHKNGSLEALIKKAQNLGSEDDITAVFSKPEPETQPQRLHITIAIIFFAFALGFFCGAGYSKMKIKETIPSYRPDIQDTLTTDIPIDTLFIKNQ